MNPVNELRFVLTDRINDAEVGPMHVPLSLLGEFQKDVSDFLKGSGREVGPDEILVAVEEGSLAFVVSGGAGGHIVMDGPGALAVSRCAESD